MAGLLLVPAIQGSAGMDGRDSKNPAMTFLGDSRTPNALVSGAMSTLFADHATLAGQESPDR